MIYRIRDFSRGISPFDEFGPQGSYADGEAVWTSDEPPFYKSYFAPQEITNDGSGGGTFDFDYMVAHNQMVFGTESGDLWDVDQTLRTPTGTLSERIGGGTLGNGHGLALYYNRNSNASLTGIYWVSSSGILSQADVTADPISASNATISGGPGSNASGVYQGLIEKFGILYAGLGSSNINDPINLSSWDGTTHNLSAVDLPEFGNVNCLGESEDYIVMGLDNGMIYLYDGYSDSWNYRYRMADEPKSMYYLDGITYIWAPPSLYAYAQGEGQPQRVATIPAHFRDNNQYNTFDAKPGSLTASEGMLVMSCYASSAASNKTDKIGIFSFGALNGDMPASLQYLYHVADTADTTENGQGVHALAYVAPTSKLYASVHNTSGSMSVQTWAPSYDRTNSQLDTLWTDLGVPEAEKQLMRVGVHTRPMASAASVGVQYRTDYGSAFSPMSLSVVNDTYRYGTLLNAPLGRSYQFRLTINASGASSPVIKGIDAHFEAANPSDFGQ